MSKKRLNLISSIITGNINRILKLDPEHDKLLVSLENESLWLFISDWHLLIHISADSNNNKLNLDCYKSSKNLNKLDELSDDDINKSQNKNQAHQLLIYGKAHNFIKLSRTQNPQEVFQDKDINYDGSFNILLHYHRFYQQLDLDLSALLTSLLGDHLGGFLSEKIKPFINSKTENCHKYKEKLVDYLEREKRVIVPKEELEDWIEDIAQLVQDVERIEAKIKV